MADGAGGGVFWQLALAGRLRVAQCADLPGPGARRPALAARAHAELAASVRRPARPRRGGRARGSSVVATLSRYDALRHLAAHREGWIWLRTLVDLRRLARDESTVFDGPLSRGAAISLAAARSTIGTGPAHRRRGPCMRSWTGRRRRCSTGSLPPMRPTCRSPAPGCTAARRTSATGSPRATSVADVQHTAVLAILPVDRRAPGGVGADALDGDAQGPGSTPGHRAARLRRSCPGAGPVSPGGARRGSAGPGLRSGGPCAGPPGRAA